MSSFINIAIFASGAGSNAARIIEHFSNHNMVCIKLIVCNRPGAGVLDIAKENNIESLLIEKDLFFRGDTYIYALQERKIDWIVLAGFLWKIPSSLIRAFPNHIINIHPALLPKYGGRGMYGHHVHEAVIAHKEKESGITIHYVDELYDHGKIIFQAGCPVDAHDDSASLAKKIHALEHKHYASVIEELVQKQKSR
ncbi:MAG: phosphoribosylglycinamide formyltransferase [Ferruginibacter sp.]